MLFELTAMRTKTNIRISILLSIVAGTFVCESVYSQGWRTPGAQRCAVVDCSGGNSGSRGTYTPPPPPPPSPAEIAAAQAYALNDQGTAAYNNGDWKNAEAFFRQAVEKEPNDRAYLRNLVNSQAHEGQDAYKQGDYATALNYFQQALATIPADDPYIQVRRNDLAMAQGKIDEAQRLSEQRQQDKIAADNMHQSIQNLAKNLSAVAAPSSGGLDFNQGTRTGAFGTTSNPSNPELDFSPGAPPVAVHSASEQVGSAANSGADANKKGIGNEAAKIASNCAFDKAACAAPVAIPISRVRAIGQTPGAAELFAHIPDAGKDNNQIQKSMAYYEKLDGRKIATQTKLAAVQKQIDSGAGDAEVLKARQATLNNDLKRYVADQAKTQNQIKTQLKTIKVDWIESPPAAGAPSKPQAAAATP
jgi:tetratricopeptide (TPR) repeat protein